MILRFCIITIITLFVTTFSIAQEKHDTKKTVIILAMHGGIPNDFPRAELGRFFQLHGKHSLTDQEKFDLEMLDDDLREWPRTPENDPYFGGSEILRKAIEDKIGIKVLLAFNEYCAPSIEQTISTSVDSLNAKKVIVVTPMTTTGGGHSERDIPAAIQRVQELVGDNIEIEYRWPIPQELTTQFMVDVINTGVDGMKTMTISKGNGHH